MAVSIGLAVHCRKAMAMAQKGRHHMRKGSWDGLNAVDDERIRDLRRSGCTMDQIADWLGISQATVSFVLSGKRLHSHAT